MNKHALTHYRGCATNHGARQCNINETGATVGTGATEDEAIAAAAANMAAGTKAHCAQMGITPRAVIKHFLENEDYALVAMAS
jgi:hypothetical protein